MSSSKKDAHLGILLDNKQEYTDALCDVLIESMVQEVQSMYHDARKSQKTQKDGILKGFQEECAGVPKWNSDLVSLLFRRMLDNSACPHFSDLVKATLVTNYQCLLALDPEKRKGKISVRLPNSEHFVHKCMIVFARALWKRPYLLYHQVRSIEMQRNLLICEDLARKSIKQVVREMIPIDEVVHANTRQTARANTSGYRNKYASTSEDENSSNDEENSGEEEQDQDSIAGEADSSTEEQDSSTEEEEQGEQGEQEQEEQGEEEQEEQGEEEDQVGQEQRDIVQEQERGDEEDLHTEFNKIQLQQDNPIDYNTLSILVPEETPRSAPNTDRQFCVDSDTDEEGIPLAAFQETEVVHAASGGAFHPVEAALALETEQQEYTEQLMEKEPSRKTIFVDVTRNDFGRNKEESPDQDDSEYNSSTVASASTTHAALLINHRRMHMPKGRVHIPSKQRGPVKDAFF